MDEYDETEDIDNLLRSALRGDSANATSVVTTGGSHPESEDSATRRRRIRLGKNAFGELHPLTEEKQSDEERAVLLNSAIPEKSRTPLQNEIQSQICGKTAIGELQHRDSLHS